MFQLTTCSQVLACVQGEFKASAYYAECVDLIRKLVLSSLVGLLSPGTVIQSFATALFSLIFMVLHALMCKCRIMLLIHRQLAVSNLVMFAKLCDTVLFVYVHAQGRIRLLGPICSSCLLMHKSLLWRWWAWF